MIPSNSTETRLWREQAREMILSNSPNILTAANANMAVFSIPSTVHVLDVQAALEQVLSEYRQKVQQAGKTGLFYAWMDEMSGTFRCSFCEARTFGELPFECTLKRAESLAEIAGSAHAAHAHGIPARELVEVEWTSPDETTGPELLVFAEACG